jgi:hypothetical protein
MNATAVLRKRKMDTTLEGLIDLNRRSVWASETAGSVGSVRASSGRLVAGRVTIRAIIRNVLTGLGDL